MSNAWLIWWWVLCAAALVNVAAWLVSARMLGHHEALLPADVRTTRRRLLWLAAIYVAGCGFRSVLPMVDVPRICLHDTWLSSIFVGRSIATVAELAFAAQWALLMREACSAGGPLVARVSRVIFPLIVVAEIFSWDAVLRTNNLSHAIENSLWTLAAVLAVAAIVAVRPRLDETGRRFAAAAVVCGIGYIAFMTIVDVPMYLARWQADIATGHDYLPWSNGLLQIMQPCAVTRDWAAWREDVPWLTLYFTVAVWISVALPHAPQFRTRAGGRATDSRTVTQQS